MNALRQSLPAWIDNGEPFAIATVVAVSGSAPRAPGACMLISEDGSLFTGSVSSGCLEAEVIEAAKTAIRTSEARRLKFGPDGLPPWRDGLTCGGWIDVRVEPWWGHSPRAEVRAIGSLVRSWIENDTPGVVLSNDSHHLALDADGQATGDTAFDQKLITRALDCLAQELPPFELEGAHGSVFVRTIRPRPRLLVVGAVDVAVALVAMASTAGFSTTVVDPRRYFAQPGRFQITPDQLLRTWPQPAIAEAAFGPRDAAIVLTHDPKIDDPALLALLETGVGYIGALGSSRSHSARLERLSSQVADAATLRRIHGPAGLHLGASDAAGIAVGILAGLTQWQAVVERARIAASAHPVIR